MMARSDGNVIISGSENAIRKDVIWQQDELFQLSNNRITKRGSLHGLRTVVLRCNRSTRPLFIDEGGLLSIQYMWREVRRVLVIR